MRMYDKILKKRNGRELSREEIFQIVEGYTKGSIPDYQMSAFLMAVYFTGMTDEEAASLTEAMAASGDCMDLSRLPGVKVDKHSTGGVGDKTSLIVVPIAAACGCVVAKMSGRGLGHTGGTVDKLASIPGFRTDLTEEEFFETVRRTGLAITGQTGNLTPADKKIYALRDVTATVDSIPLIASSIMSKKLASGSDCIVLDVKTGSGAFMKTLEDSVRLAEKMTAIGESRGRRVSALITDMNQPLGRKIGNALEVEEAVAVLRGEGPEDLEAVSLALAAEMLFLAGKGSRKACRSLAEDALASGSALRRLADMTEAQGGDRSLIEGANCFAQAPAEYELKAEEDGFLVGMDAESIGIAAMLLGAGRETKESEIDPLAGIILEKKTGERISRGDILARLRTSAPELAEAAAQRMKAALTIGPEPPKPRPLLYARVTADGTEWLENR